MLRERVAYVAGRSKLLDEVQGSYLDVFASSYNLRRRSMRERWAHLGLTEARAHYDWSEG